MVEGLLEAPPATIGGHGGTPAHSSCTDGPASTPTVTPARARRLGSLRREEGQSAVELALVVPVICLLVLALVDFGKALNYWLDANHLANLGARQAAVIGSSAQPGGNLACWVRSQAETWELRDGGGDSVAAPANVQISFLTGPTGTTGKIGDPVRVLVTANYKWIPFVGGATFTLKGEATMRLERLPAPALNGQSC